MNLRVISDPVERARFLKFATVGAIGALVDFATFNLFSALLGVHPVLSSVFSFTIAMLSNFTWNRYWTYPDSRSKPLARQLVEYGVVNLVGLLIRTPLFAAINGLLISLFERVPFLPIGIFTPIFLGHNLALGTAILVVMLWNYFVNRYWTYNDIE
jgi:putative flippase GtrA